MATKVHTKLSPLQKTEDPDILKPNPWNEPPLETIFALQDFIFCQN